MEAFVIDHYQFISTIFGCFAASFIGFRVLGTLINAYRHVCEVGQRQGFQAGYFDLQEQRYTDLLNKYVKLESDIVNIKAKN